MDFFTQKRFMIGLMIGLVVFNFLSVSLLLYREFTRRSPQNESFRPGGPVKMAAILEKELNFNPEQIARFRELRREFNGEADQNRAALDELRKQVMGETLSETPDTSKIDKLAIQIGQAEIKKTKLIANHFQKIKALCRPDQRENFNRLLKELSRQLGPPPHPPFRRPHQQPNRKMRPAPQP